MLGVVAVLPLFIGWWELGRPVSFSPLEVAKAFDAPLLGAVDSIGGKEGIAEQVRVEVGRVRYGVVDEVGGDGMGVRQRLKISNVGGVRTPGEGGTYD